MGEITLNNNKFADLENSNPAEIIAVTENFRSDISRMFFDLGENFTENFKIIKNVISISSETLNNSFGEKIEQKISELFSIFFEIELLTRTSELVINSGKDHLNRIQNYLEQTQTHAEGFGKIVKQLRMLGIATKIENARLNNDATGFNILAENVENLSDKINLRQSDIAKSTAALNSRCSKIIDEISSIRAKQSVLIKEIFENKDKAINKLSENYEASLVAVEKVKTLSEKISKNINEIISAVQYGDITSQQTEHVINSLSEAQRKFEENGFERSSAVNFCGVLKLQQAQLNNTSKDISGSVNTINYSTQNIKNSIIELNEILSSVSINNSSENSLEGIKSKIDATKSLIEKNHEVHSGLINSVSEVFSAVKILSNLINEIEEAGTEIELISLNAIIKSTHSGKEGAALGVLSDAIRRLSNDAKEQTFTVSNIFEKIMSETRELKSINEKQTGEEQKNKTGEIINSLQRETSELSNTGKILFEKLNEINLSTGKIEHSIEQQIYKIENLNESGNKIEMISAMINQTVEDLQNKFEINDEMIQADLSEFADQYSMQSEREVHRSLTEIIKDEMPVNIDQSLSDEDFGDNIELF